MYPSTTQPAWNPGAPPTTLPPTHSPQQAVAQQGQPQQQLQQMPPQQWGAQPNGHYPPRPGPIPPNTQAMPPQPMQPMQPMPMQPAPQHHTDYAGRALPPLYPPGPYAQHPPPMAYAPPHAAPRQRTAIACRYCRRRKIRCSGFESSEDGRCSNCQRFSQECIFTPVSAQTQAFVPAQSAYGRGPVPPGTQIYGAYGQRLPADAYPQQGHPAPAPASATAAAPAQPGQYPPPPHGYAPQGYPPNGQAAGAKRPSDEPHTPTLPPTAPGGYVYPADPNLAARPPAADPITGILTHLNQDSNARRLERIRLGEIRDADTQTDPVEINVKAESS